MDTRVKEREGEKGQSLVELALSITVLLIILAGSFDLGRTILYYLNMRNAAQEGVTYGVVFPTFCNQIYDRTFFTLSDPDVQVNVKIDGNTCDPLDVNACYNHNLEVIVENPNFPMSMPFIGTFLGSQTIHLRASVTGKIVRPAVPNGQTSCPAVP